MKQLTQAVFDLPECPDWALSAAVNAYGIANYYDVDRNMLIDNQETGLFEHAVNNLMAITKIGTGYDTTNWQNSAINRA